MDANASYRIKLSRYADTVCRRIFLKPGRRRLAKAAYTHR